MWMSSDIRCTTPSRLQLLPLSFWFVLWHPILQIQHSSSTKSFHCSRLCVRHHALNNTWCLLHWRAKHRSQLHTTAVEEARRFLSLHHFWTKTCCPCAFHGLVWQAFFGLNQLLYLLSPLFWTWWDDSHLPSSICRAPKYSHAHRSVPRIQCIPPPWLATLIFLLPVPFLPQLLP